MPNNKRMSQGAEKPRASLYEDITARIIADLEQGRFPWAQPWGSPDLNAPLGFPRNAATARIYSGINVLILWSRVFEKGYPTQNWLTFRQARVLGGSVRKGEQGISVCYADCFVPKGERQAGRPAAQHANDRRGAPDAGATTASEDADGPDAIPLLRRYTVFNVAQCDRLPDHCLGNPAALPDRQMIPHAEALARATLADIRHDSMLAYYVPSEDAVHLPPQPTFFDQINYYRTLFHELGHWTGHARRLSRDLSNPFGSKGYAREELVAEITAAFVCAALAIVPTVRHADYIGHWLDVLREDNRAIFQAASKASKAANYILAFAEPNAPAQSRLPHHD